VFCLKALLEISNLVLHRRARCAKKRSKSGGGAGIWEKRGSSFDGEAREKTLEKNRGAVTRVLPSSKRNTQVPEGGKEGRKKPATWKGDARLEEKKKNLCANSGNRKRDLPVLEGGPRKEKR